MGHIEDFDAVICVNTARRFSSCNRRGQTSNDLQLTVTCSFVSTSHAATSHVQDATASSTPKAPFALRTATSILAAYTVVSKLVCTVQLRMTVKYAVM